MEITLKNKIIAYDDIINWWPKLAKGGVFILDDIGWVSEAGVNYCKD